MMHFGAKPADLLGQVQNQTLASLASRPNGFNTIRLLAAMGVIFSHAFPLTGQMEPLVRATDQASIGTLAVSTFFMISGFLIPASLDRGSLGQYAIKRGCRIMPALFVAVLISAFGFGLLLTRLPASEYLLHPQTWRFVGNAILLPTGYDLPGVFANHPLPAMNGSLWSLKFEVACYAFVVVLSAIASLRKLAAIAAWLGSLVITPLIADDAGGIWFYIDQTAGLYRFFGIGMLFYLFADRIPMQRKWGWLAAAATLAAAFTGLFIEVAATAGSYAIITLAYFSGNWFKQMTAKGDISYGIYLYAFPIQQALLPVSLGFALPWLANALLTLPLVMLAGVLSWVLIEKPALDFGRRAAQGLIRTTTSPAGR